MTREQKIAKRIERSKRRKGKKIQELKDILSKTSWSEYTFRVARDRVRGHFRYHICEMRYEDCELRGYCNGDC